MLLGKRGKACQHLPMLPCMVPILPSVFLACYWIQCVAVVEWAFYRKDGTSADLKEKIAKRNDDKD